MRSCIDHLYVLCTLLRIRKQDKKVTYVCFIDFTRAFDTINHTLLKIKLSTLGIWGRFYRAIDSIYRDMQGCVRIHNFLTEWFPIRAGIRQGDVIGPTMFSIYVNDLAAEIKQMNLGVSISDETAEKLALLMFADDITLLADTPGDLQAMINKVSKYCEKWRLFVNIAKTNIIHFRNSQTPQTSVHFYYRNQVIEKVKSRRYLGIEVSEYVDFNIIVNTLSDASSRALGALTAKYYKAKDMCFDVYQHVYNTCVAPIMDYASEVRGFKCYQKSETVQHQAIKTFLGVGKTCPTPMIIGDSGCFPAYVRCRCKMISLWNKLVTLSDRRLLKRVFLYDYSKCESGANSWCSDIKQLMTQCDMRDIFDNKYLCPDINEKLKEQFAVQWKLDVNNMIKLEHYKYIKPCIGLENYVNAFYLTCKQRSVLAYIRSGTLPIEIEKGRWRSIVRENRHCKQCKTNVVEDLEHFLVICLKTESTRNCFMGNINSIVDISHLSNSDKIHIVLTDTCLHKLMSNFIIKLMKCRN